MANMKLMCTLNVTGMKEFRKALSIIKQQQVEIEELKEKVISNTLNTALSESSTWAYTEDWTDGTEGTIDYSSKKIFTGHHHDGVNNDWVAKIENWQDTYEIHFSVKYEHRYGYNELHRIIYLKSDLISNLVIEASKKGLQLKIESAKICNLVDPDHPNLTVDDDEVLEFLEEVQKIIEDAKSEIKSSQGSNQNNTKVSAKQAKEWEKDLVKKANDIRQKRNEKSTGKKTKKKDNYDLFGI